MSNNLCQQRTRQDDLSSYIKRQLSTILKKVQQTPIKKTPSLKKIKKIIQKSQQITKRQKDSIQKQIKKVQIAIKRSNSLHNIKEKIKKQPKSGNKYEKNLFYQNMILEEKQLNIMKKLESNRKGQSNNKLQLNSRVDREDNRIKSGDKRSLLDNYLNGQISDNYQKSNKKQTNKIQNIKGQQFINLISTFQQLRTKRLQYQNKIQQYQIKSQRLQRLIELKRQNQQKYQQQAIISKKYQQKKLLLQTIKCQVKLAAKQNRIKTINHLMKKYTQVQQFN